MNSKSPRISIITPSFNQGHFIEETILSVLDQDYPNLEYIIMDGGSSDNTVEIIRKYEKYLSFWRSERDAGQSNAINKGVRHATGDIVNWLNSDDYYMPGTLDHVASIFLDSNITAYCGRSRVFSEHTEKISNGTDIYHNNLAKTIGWARIDQPETFFRKTVWDRIGLLNEDFHYVMDKEWWIRYLLYYGLDGLIRDDKQLVNFRIHDHSKTGSQLKSFAEETRTLFYSLALLGGYKEADHFSIFNIRPKNLHCYPEIEPELLNNLINYFFLHQMLEAYAQNNYSMAIKLAKVIEPALVDGLDLREYNKVRLRMKLVPIQLKKLFNKF